MRRFRQRLRLAVLCAALLLPCAGWGGKWVVYENCTLADNPANDGDSFHVLSGGREYLFRLYFVDAPETSALFPERVREQAGYFGIGEREALDCGKKAQQFTRQFLKGGFTVHTRKQNARGMSGMKRYFALVRAGERDLGEELVKQGLARVYGAGSSLPDGADSKRQWAALRSLEKTARGLRRGAWRSSRTMNVSSGHR